jgi:TM2 domain-containing membrane protein YozV/DNA-directed RNA polymerase subunit RPC12/RpoP
MAIFICVPCDYSKTVDDSKVGQSAKCPKCDHRRKVISQDTSPAKDAHENPGSPDYVEAVLVERMESSRQTRDSSKSPERLNTKTHLASLTADIWDDVCTICGAFVSALINLVSKTKPTARDQSASSHPIDDPVQPKPAGTVHPSQEHIQSTVPPQTLNEAPTIFKHSRITLAIIAFILGALGIHKFMMGFPKEGLMMIGVCIFCAPFFIGLIAMTVVGIIEGAIYIGMDDDEFHQKYEVERADWF